MEHPPQVIDDCFNLYASTNLTYKQIAEKSGISYHTLKEWSVKHGWSKRKKALAKRMQEKSDATAIQIQQRHRARLIRRDIETSDTIEDAVRDQMNTMLNQFEKLRKSKKNTLDAEVMAEFAKITHLLTRCSKTGSDISARAVALDNKKFGEGGDNDKGMTFHGPVQMNIAGEKIKQGRSPSPDSDPVTDAEPIEATEVLDDFPMAD